MCLYVCVVCVREKREDERIEKRGDGKIKKEREREREREREEREREVIHEPTRGEM